MKQIILKNGLIAGVLISTFTVISMAFCYSSGNFDGNMFLGFTAMFAAFSFVFVGTKNYRDKISGGKISFFTAFKVGLGISALASLVYVFAWTIEYYFFMPDFLDKMNNASIQKFQSQNLNPTELAAKMKDLEFGKRMYENILTFFLITFAEIFPVGLVVTIVSSLILKKK